MSEERLLAGPDLNGPYKGPGFASQLRQALLIVWLVLSLAGAVVVLLPFVIDAPALSSVYPQSHSWHRDGQPCVLCGMTGAFYLIAGGELEQARAANAGSLWLYGLLALNALLCAFYLLCWGRRRWRQGRTCTC